MYVQLLTMNSQIFTCLLWRHNSGNTKAKERRTERDEVKDKCNIFFSLNIVCRL